MPRPPVSGGVAFRHFLVPVAHWRERTGRPLAPPDLPLALLLMGHATGDGSGSDAIEALTLTGDVYTAMVDRALTQNPSEACGLFSGNPGTLRVDGYHPMANMAAADEAWKLYVLDGQEMLRVEAEADDAGRAIIGVMHSHTHTSAYPSPTDVADAARFDPFGTWVFIIISLKHSSPVLRAYRIMGGEITEVPVSIDHG